MPITLGSGPVLLVSKSGSDTTGNGSPGNEFLSVVKACSVATVGCTIQVKANGRTKTIYKEDTLSSPYAPDQYFFDTPVAVGIRNSGAINNRCTLMAYPGDEGLVVIDGDNTHVGIHTNGFDFWNIYGLQIRNCQDLGIANQGQVPDHVPDLAYLSTGVIVENCYVANVHGLAGGNISGIGPWGSKDWIIRNCFIDGVIVTGSSVASAIQSYGAINLLVEHIAARNTQYGVFLKDHFTATESPRDPYPGVEVRYCDLKTLNASVKIGIRGQGSCEAGDQYFHHNIMYGQADDSEGVISATMLGAFGQSKRLRIENNTIDIQSSADAQLVASNWENINLLGNIFCGGNVSIYTLDQDYPGAITRITSSDRNVFTNFKSVLNTYSAFSTVFNSLEDWQAAVAGSPQHLGVSNPDANSISASASTLFVNRSTGNYALASGSAAIGRMADGSNAGAYQYGTEIIGLLPTYSAGDSSDEPTVDTQPNPITLTNATNAAPGADVSLGQFTVSEVAAATNIPVGALASGLKYRVSTNGGTTWGALQTTPGNVQLGNVVEVFGTASATFGAVVNYAFSYGSPAVSASASVTTRAADATPTAFTFGSVTGANLNSTQTSNLATLANLDIATVSVTNGLFSKNGGAFTSTPTTAVSDDTLRIRHTASGSPLANTVTTLTVGTYSTTFTSTTNNGASMPNNLTLTSAAFAARTSFGQVLTGGDGVTSAPIITSGDFCVSLWINCATSGGVRVFASQAASPSVQCFWLGIDGTGNLIGAYGTASLNTTTVVANSTWRHIELNMSSTTGAKLFVDGALVLTVATTPAAAGCVFTHNFYVAKLLPSFSFVGSVDEVAVFSVAQHSSAFTAPTAPYTGSEANLLALWHLDGNGNDSVVSSVQIAPDSAGIFFSPLNWSVTSGGATSINPGAYFRTLISANSCTLKFDVSAIVAPNPRIVIVVDGVTCQRAALAATVIVTMPSGQDNQVHLLEVYIDSATRTANRWTAPRQTAVIFTGLSILGGAATAALPEKRQKTVLIYGDSITEGTRTLNGDTGLDVDGSSCTASWALRLGALLGAESSVVGFASAGILANGVGNVPPLPTSWNLLYAGVSRSFATPPDYCIWLEGTNDGINNTVSAGITVLNAQLTAMPGTKFFIFRPLNGTSQASNLQAIVAGCSDPSRVNYIDTAGYWASADSSDTLHPYGYAGQKIAHKMAGAIQAVIGSSAPDIYPTPVTFAPVLVAPSTLGTSAAGALSSFVGPLDLAVTGGSSSVDAGAFTTASKAVTAGQSFRLQATSNATPGGFSVVSFTLSLGAVVVDAGNFVVMSTASQDDVTPTAPTLNGVTGATVGDYAPINTFTVAGVTAGVNVPITTGPGVQVRVATTTGGALGAPQTGIVNVQLGYDVQLSGLAVSGAIDRFAAFGTLLLSFNVAAPSISTLPYSIPQSRIWKIGASNIGAFPAGSELMRAPNGGVRTIKDPDANLDYGIDFGAANNGDPIASAQVITTNLTAVQTVQNATFVGFNASGGAVGTRGRVTVRVTRESGVTDDRSIAFDFVDL